MHPKDIHHDRPQHQRYEEDKQEREIFLVTPPVTLYGHVIFQVTPVLNRDTVVRDEVLTLNDGEDTIANSRKHQINSKESYMQELLLADPVTSY